MKPIASNEEFWGAIDGLIDSWCERRALKPLSWVLRPYFAFNGLTDGWTDLLNGFKSIHLRCRDDVSEQELEILCELIRTAKRALNSR